MQPKLNSFILILSLLCLVSLQSGFGQYTMPTGINASTNVNTCSGTLTDNNGPNSDYSNNQKTKFILCPDQPDKSIQVSFTSFDIEPGFDSLVIVNRGNYTGQAFTEPNVIGVYWGTNNPGTITSTHSTGCLTFYFSSDGSINEPGFSCDISCVDKQYAMPTGINMSTSVNTCSGTLTDNNGPSADYSNNQKSKFILCPDQPDKSIQVNFTSFDIEPGFDSLVIVNRDNYTGQAFTEPNVIGVYWGTNNPGTINSTHSTGCLTFYFSSDGSINKPGFSCDISCVEGCSPPEAVCSNYSLALDESGNASITVSDIDGGSTAGCGLQSITISEQNFDCNDLGNNMVTLTVLDMDGNSDDCTAMVTIQDGVGLSSSWNGTDIGNITLGNAYNFEACAANGGQYTATGSGNNAISTTTDNVAFASQTLCGDGMITAKIKSITPNGFGGFGGLMIRETTAAGAKQVSVFSNLTNILRHEHRAATNGAKQVQAFNRQSPFWLRLQRQGVWVFAYYSATGTSFSYLHAVYAPMQNCVEIGLASFTYLPTGQTEATFSNVSTTGNIIPLVSAGTLPSSDIASSEVGPISTPELFPNPANSQFTLRFPQALPGEATATLRNQVGQVLQQRQLQPGDLTTEWNVSDLPAGLYFMEVRQEGLPPQVLRMVKQQ